MSSLLALLVCFLLAAPSVPVSGWATWYRDPKHPDDGLYAAAGPALRVGDWRGRSVTVCAGRCVVVTLSDWCACGSRHGVQTVIDLSPAAFRQLAPLSQGVVRVTVQGVPNAPATDVGG